MKKFYSIYFCWPHYLWQLAMTITEVLFYCHRQRSAKPDSLRRRYRKNHPVRSDRSLAYRSRLHSNKSNGNRRKWVSLDPASGEAGEITIKLALSTNYTGTDRKATIHIICGGTTITVIIEQKGETENGEVPDEDSPADGVRKISEIITSTDGEPNHIVFTYDEQGRVQEYSLYKEISGQKKQNT